MGFRKDKRGISTRNSPPTLTLILSITTTCPTVTSKMNPLTPKRSTRKPPKATTQRCRRVLTIQARKCFRPCPRNIRHSHHPMQARFKKSELMFKAAVDRSKYLAAVQNAPNAWSRMSALPQVCGCIGEIVQVSTRVPSRISWRFYCFGSPARRWVEKIS